MSIYKESMLNKIEDDLQGRNQNWDTLEAHLADYAAHGATTEKNGNTMVLRGSDGTIKAFGGGDADHVLTIDKKRQTSYSTGQTLSLVNDVHKDWDRNIAVLFVHEAIGVNSHRSGAFLISNQGTQITVTTLESNLSAGISVGANYSNFTITNNTGSNRLLKATIVKVM